MQVEWTAVALKQLDLVHKHYADISPKLAAGIFRMLAQATERLEQFPLSGRLGQLSGTRELIVSGLPFLVVYRVREEEVAILRVFHTARDWPLHLGAGDDEPVGKDE